MGELRISLKAARVNADLTQADAARKMGVSVNTMLSWEQGQTSPSIKQAVALSELYRMPLDNIFLPSK